MIKCVGLKRGDTLIEVMFAVGVFSLVAIAVVSVMNGSLRSIQGALETTMTRNEIDAQAEAIRFIQSAYIAEKDLAEDKQVYTAAWKKIVKLAEANDVDIATFEPAECGELYEKTDDKSYIASQNAFVVNTRKLGVSGDSDNSDVAIITAGKSSGKFEEAGTYPRLIFGGDANTLSNTASSMDLTYADGIYVVGIKDTEGTYYDFYIRTCWNSAGANQVSTISTVIRLYNPDL